MMGQNKKKGSVMDTMKKERFDTIVIPDNLSQRVKQGIREGEKIYMRNKRRKIMVRTAAAAAVLFVCAGVFASQPALASRVPVIGNIFKLLQGDYSYQGDLDSVAYTFEEPEGKENGLQTGKNPKGEESRAADSAYTKTKDGVTVSISEAYCSVEAIYLSLEISSEEAFPDTMIDLEGKPVLSLKGTAEYSFLPAEQGEENGYCGAEGSLEGAFMDRHTFVGIYRIDLVSIVGNNDALKETYRALDAFDMHFAIEQIIGDKAEPEKLDMRGKTEEELEAMSDEEWKAFMDEITPADRNQYPNRYENWWLDGPFAFDLHIEADKENAQIVTVDDMNDTGAGLYQIVKTKFEITVEEKCDEERTKSGVFLVVLDADGKMLPYGSSSITNTYAINGRDVSKVFVYVCDYVEYMDEIKAYRKEADFQQTLEQKALYRREIVF